MTRSVCSACVFRRFLFHSLPPKNLQARTNPKSRDAAHFKRFREFDCSYGFLRFFLLVAVLTPALNLSLLTRHPGRIPVASFKKVIQTYLEESIGGAEISWKEINRTARNSHRFAPKLNSFIKR